MSNQLNFPFSSDVEVLTAERLRLAASVRAPRTIASYQSDWKDFETWAAKAGICCFPAQPETVALYLTELLNRPCRITTASRRVTSINARHRDAGHAPPGTREVCAVIVGAQRIRGEQPQGKTPLSVAQLRAIVATLNENGHLTIRNRAILLFGFATALRRSNIVAMLVEDVEFVTQGMRVRVRREKQDQRGKGRTIGVPAGGDNGTCPVRAVQSWLTCRGSAPGPLFTRICHGKATANGVGPHVVARVVKDAIIRVGLEPAKYAGHSLRAGFVTEALDLGVGEIKVANHTGHRSLSTLRKYYRPSDPFKSNACAALGL